MRGGGGIPQRIIASSVPASELRITGRVVRENPGHRGEVAHVSIDDAEEAEDGFLVGRDGIKIAHLRCSGNDNGVEDQDFFFQLILSFRKASTCSKSIDLLLQLFVMASSMARAS